MILTALSIDGTSGCITARRRMKHLEFFFFFLNISQATIKSPCTKKKQAYII